MERQRKSAVWQVLVAAVAAAGAMVSVGAARPPAPAQTAAIGEVADPRREAIAAYFAEKYRADPDQTRELVEQAHDAAREVGVDPLLVYAVISVESRFNPIARSQAGAKGLMQVMARVHRDRLAEHGGEAAVFHPRVNVLVGAQILKEYVEQTGSLRAGLQRYVGSADDAEQRYARKVLAEKARLQRLAQQALAGETS